MATPTYGLLGRPGALPGAMVVAWSTNFTWILFLDNPVGVTGGPLGRLVEAFGQVGFPLFLATLPAAALALALRFRRARGVERQQLKWLPPPG